MQPSLFLFLVFCNIGWSFHSVLVKWILVDFSPLQGSILRYGSAALAYWIYSFTRPASKPSFAVPRSKKDVALFLLLGLGPFMLTPILQFSGLARSQSIDNAIVIAIEPLFSVFLAWLILREGLRWFQTLSFGLAMVGFLLVSKLDFHHGNPFSDFHFFGFFLMIMALWGESIFSVLGRLLTQRYEPVALYGTAIFIGALALILFGAFQGELPDLSKGSVRSMGAVLYLGPIGTTLSYVFWMKLIRHAPVASLVITLFVQPVFGSLWGVLFLKEHFNLHQTIGALLILVAIVFQSTLEMRGIKK